MSKSLMERMFSLTLPSQPTPIAAGVYHAMREIDGRYTRLHLRVEHNGSGILMINSQAAAQLTKTGVIIAKGLMDKTPEEDILKNLQSHFRGTTRETMLNDVAEVKSLLERMMTPGRAYPIINFDDIASDTNAPLIAPLKVDVDLAPPDKLLPIIDRLWHMGVPHITIQVSEQPQANYLIRAIEHAEDLGMIAGVRGRGSDFLQGTLLPDMAQVGVDYVMVLYLSSNPAQHDPWCGIGDHAAAEQVIAQTIQLEVCPVAHVALVSSTLDTIGDTLAALHDHQVDYVFCFALVNPSLSPPSEVLTEQSIPQIEVLLKELAEQWKISLTLQPSIRFDPSKTLAQQIHAGPRSQDSFLV